MQPKEIVRTLLFKGTVPVTQLGSSLFGTPAPDRPVFVVGAQRSGTRLLASYLNLSPRLCEWSEGNYIWQPHYYHPLNCWYTRRAIPAFFGKGVYAHEIPRPHRARLKKRVRRLLGWYGWWEGKRVLHRNPYNSIRVSLLLEWFEGSRVVHIVRDARAAVQSFLHRHTEGELSLGDYYSEEELVRGGAYRWRVCLDKVRRVREAYPNRVAEIKYAQLAEQLERILGDLYAFCELDPAEISLREGPDVENRNYKWRENLTPSLVSIIEEEVGDPSPEPEGIPT